MEIKHDRSYIQSSDREFAARGYGHERVRSLRFQFVYTEEQREANRKRPGPSDMSVQEWDDICAKSAQMRSNHMERVMQAIGEKHWCYQYNKDHDLKLFKSDNWDLFFWCNDFYNSMKGVLSGRDYSYFTLNFNDSQTAEKQREVYDSVMQILSQFQEDENIEIAVQYEIVLDEAKIKADADEVAESLIGKRVTYMPTGGVILIPCQPMEGRIVNANGQLFFMKKWARNRGYLLESKDIIQIFWNMEKAS